MLIVCPNCATSYDVKPNALGDAGRTVRCASCRKEWFATPQPAPAARTEIPAEFATPPVAAAVAEAAAAPPDPFDWDAPAEPSDAAAAIPTDEAGAEDEISAVWGMPQTESPPIAPSTPASDPATVEATAMPFEDVETLAAKRALRLPRRRLDRVDLPLVPTIIAVQLVVIVACLLWRAEIVNLMPQTASFFRSIGFGVNIRGLEFTDIHTSKDTHDGVTVLIVEGSIVNTTRATAAVPRLRFALRNASLAELFSWTMPPEKGTLGPGETLPFHSRLASPPVDGNDILVRFLNRLDFVNGTR
jgi:predicted Zn finger-like uncharacterized protein